MNKQPFFTTKRLALGVIAKRTEPINVRERRYDYVEEFVSRQIPQSPYAGCLHKSTLLTSTEIKFFIVLLR